MSKVLGIILAGGQATRMGGGDKCLLEVGGQPLLAGIVERLAGQVDGILLNANGDPARFAEFGLPVIPDSITGFAGPLAGVLAGMDAAAERGADRIVTVAGDTPFFPRDLAERLMDAAQQGNVPLALAATPDAKRGSARHPTFGLWPVALRDDLRAALGDGLRKVVMWTDRHGCATAMFEDEDAFFNLNTPEDLARARAMAEAT